MQPRKGDEVIFANIYAKKLNGAQRALLLEYVARCGFEPMGQDDLDAGRITFAQLWKRNVNWIQNVADDINALPTGGTGA
jgi:hypothetical protein